MRNLTVAHLRDEKKLELQTPSLASCKTLGTRRLSPKSTTQTSLQNARIEAEEERTPSLLVVRRAEQRLALAEQLLRRRAPRVVTVQSRSVDRHAPTCAVQADLDA